MSGKTGLFTHKIIASAYITARMEWEIGVEPETEESLEMVRQVAAIRDYGIEELGLEREEVAMTLIQMGATLVDTEERDPLETDTIQCPNCGAPMVGVEAESVGSDPEAMPCGCELSWDEVPEKFTPTP